MQYSMQIERKPVTLRRFLALLAAAALLTAGAMAWNAWLEPEEICVRSALLPEAFEGFRVAVLADLHGRTDGPAGERLVRAVREAGPDLIALCGDMIDTEADIPALAALCRRLSEIAPIYYVTGNHEWAARCVVRLRRTLSDAGAACLDGTYVILTRGGAQLVLSGVADPNGQTPKGAPAALVEAIRRSAPQAYILMLSHRNDAPGDWAQLGVQTVLSGHGHGGLVYGRHFGGLVDTDRTLFPDFVSGAYRSGGTTVVVSRGLGGVRLLCRPHLPVVTLRCENGQKVNNP